MKKREITIVNKLGLHARAAAKFVSTASGFESEVTLAHNSARVNGKSIMGIMMLAAGQGTTLELEVEGPDEDLAYHTIIELIESRFGEDE
jgi:phosphocarrier protein HPr